MSKEFICAVHNSYACVDCVFDFQRVEAELARLTKEKEIKEHCIVELEKDYADLKRRLEKMRTALERIKSRSSKIMQKQIRCTNFSAAMYNYDVAEKALTPAPVVEKQGEHIGETTDMLFPSEPPAQPSERDKALEEAARVCELTDEVNNGHGDRFIQPKTTNNVNGFAYAAAIRSLKSTNRAGK